MDIFAITPTELSSERTWWRAMGYPGGAIELIEKHDLARVFQETYQQTPNAYFRANPEFAFDPTLFEEFTGHLRHIPNALPILGAPVSVGLKEAAANVWRSQGVPGALEFFVQQGIMSEVKDALGGWEPQALMQVFPEHSDGVMLAASWWWRNKSARDNNDCSEQTLQAFNALEPLMHQLEVECALPAQDARAPSRR